MKRLPELTYNLKLKTKNSILASCFLLFAFLAFPASAQAQNIVGVNIANHLADFDQAAQIVGNGGWVYIMATPGDCGTIQEKAQAHPEVNIVIRGQTPYQVLDADLALAWAATLANMNTPNKIYFMPSNEPNGPSPGDVMDAGALKNYIAELIKRFDETGIRGSKVVLLSPMINQYQFGSYLTSLGGAAFFRQFDGISMNLYDTEENCNKPFCSGNNRMNARRFQEVLANDYGVPGMPVYAIETGVVNKYPRYYDDELARFYQEAIPFWQSQSNLKMFGLFSYDPTPSDALSAAWNLFAGTKTAQVLKSFAGGGATSPETFNEESFRTSWLQPKLDSGELQFCDGCGIVADPQDCLASETAGPGPVVEQIYTPTRWVETGEMARSDSDAATLLQTASLNEGVDGPIRIKSAAYYELFEDMSIPFARELAVYLAGPFVYQGNTKINEVLTELKTNSPLALNKLGVLTKLTPLEVQDDMRRDYWQKCNDGTFCSSRNIGTTMCPTAESNECLIADGTDIFAITPPPAPEDFTDQAEYYQTYRRWQTTQDGIRWSEIPLVSNPYSRVNPSIIMHSTDKNCLACGPSNYIMDTPWVSALYDISKFLNIMLIPPTVRETRRPPEEKPEEELLTSLPQSNITKLASAKSLQPAQSKNQNQVLGQKTLLAQTCTENPFYINFSSDVTDKGNGQFEVCWSISPGVNDTNHNYCDWGYTITVFVNGKTSGYFQEPQLGPGPPGVRGNAHCFSENPTITCHMGSAQPIVVAAKQGDEITASFGLTQGHCTGPCCDVFDPRISFPPSGGPSGPAGPTCQAPEPPPLKPDGLADPIRFVDGHAVCIDSVDTLTGHWEYKVTGQRINPQTGLIEDILKWTCVGKCDTSFEYEVWPKVRFPFLNQIFADDSDYRGTFQIFRPTSIDDENWDWAGESYITWCHIPAIGCFSGQTEAAIDAAEGENESNCSGVTLTSALEIYHQAFTKPPAKCFDTKTKDLKTYPLYIGGVKNAQEFVLTALNPPPGTGPQPPIPSPPTPAPEPPTPPTPPGPPTPPTEPTPTPPTPTPGPPIPPTEPTPVNPPTAIIDPGCPASVRQVSNFVFDNYTGELTAGSAAHSDLPRQATIVSWSCTNYQVVFSQEASNDPVWVFPDQSGVRYGYYETTSSNDGLYHRAGRQTQNNQVSVIKNQDGQVQIKWEYYDADAASGNRLNHAINFYTFYPGGLTLREQKFVEDIQSGYALTLLTPTLVNPVSQTWSNFATQNICKLMDVESEKERSYFATPQGLSASTWQTGNTKYEIEAAQSKILRINLKNQSPFLILGNDSGLSQETIAETHVLSAFACYTNEIIGWTPNLKERLSSETLSLYPNTCPLFTISHSPQNSSGGQHNFVLIGVASSSDSDDSLKQKARDWLNSLKSQSLNL